VPQQAKGDRIRVPHPRRAAAGWGIARSAIALLLLASASLLHAQPTPCGLTSITEQSQLVYPPIARAAHVSGTVILLTRFDTQGVPVHINVLSGPPMLQRAALDFVKNWRANQYGGPRECPLVVNFNMIEGNTPVCSDQEAGSPRFTRTDLQHVSLSTQGLWLCDPAATVTKTRKRWF
jgi:TonB family protein